jgi:hypothetical protein
MLKDMDKINHVKKELEGAHQLMGNIANRVFEYNWEERQHAADTIFGDGVSTN